MKRQASWLFAAGVFAFSTAACNRDNTTGIPAISPRVEGRPDLYCVELQGHGAIERGERLRGAQARRRGASDENADQYQHGAHSH